MIEEGWPAYLEDPARIFREEDDPVGRIASLSERFPYCQALQLLHCKALKESGKLEWHDRMNSYAPLLPDRKKLFELLERDLFKESGSHSGIPDKEEESEGVDEEVSIERSGIEGSSTSEEGAEEDAGVDPRPLEREILSEAVQQRIQRDPEEALLEDDGSSKERSDSMGMGEEERSSETSEGPEEREYAERPFTDWLDPGRTSASQPSSSSSETKGQEELLDAFITQGEETTVRSKRNSEFFSSERMARKSTEEDELPVSETLAELYLQQGDIKRAKQGFERLSLKVPEKSDYFARRAKELEERLKR